MLPKAVTSPQEQKGDKEMKYFMQYKESGEVKEITKDVARQKLDGWWTEESLDDIFDNGRSFSLYTPYTNVWTQDDNGRVPMAGFYGIVG